MSFWQFLRLLAIIALGFAVYHYWWAGQSQSAWAAKLHHKAIDSSDEPGPEEAKEYQPDSWGR